MKKLPGTVRPFAYGFLLIIFCFLAATSLAVISAQETTIPGPELKDASFVPVKDLQVGDWVFVKSGEGELLPVQISNLEYKEEPVEVYNLSVEGEETFFANDFAVHNKFGTHDAVCDVALAPRLSTARSETWTYSGCSASDGSACQSSWSQSNFKSMFEDRGFNAGGNRCFFGQAKPCFFIGTEYNMPVQCDCCELKQADCDYCEDKPNPERCEGNCDENFSNNCACWTGDVLFGYNAKCDCVAWRTSNPPGLACEPNCDAACTSYQPFNNSGSDKLRIRAPWPCPDPDAGGAIRIKAPSGYVIKSITFDVNAHLVNGRNDTGYWHNATFGVSRGMQFGLDSHIDPRVAHYTLTSTGNFANRRVDLGGGSRYAFFYLEVTADCEFTADDWVEISNIRLEIVKNTETIGREVTVINNSLLWYDGVDVTNPDLSDRWPTIQSGTISISTNNGSSWSSPVEIGTNWTVDGTLPQGAEGYKTVFARVVPTGSTAGDPATCLMTIYYRAPNAPPDCTSMTLNGGHNTHFVLNPGETISLAAQPTDTDGTVKEVRFYSTTNFLNTCNDWKLIGTDTNGSDGWSATWTPDPGETFFIPGLYYVFARVKDDKDVWCDNPAVCGVDGATTRCSTDCRWVGTIEFIANPWYQTQEGDVHGQSGVSSSIPNTCEEAGDPAICDPNFSLLGVGGYPGIISHYGSADFHEGYPSNSEDNHWLASGTLMQNQSFAYFYQLLGLPSTDEFDTLDLSDLGSLPPEADDDGVYYSDGDVTISGALPAATKAIVLVGNQTESRNVTINNDITVPLGSSLVVIASGNITIADSVSQVDGIYVADGTISTGAGGTEFFGYGSFIAVSFSLGRDFTAVDPDDVRNNTTPVEHFLYRPDLILNSPTKLWAAPLSWQELPP